MFVAHRLRTIYDSDQILVLKDGKVAEQGSHRELLEQNGIYSELWSGECLLGGLSTELTAPAQEMSLAQDVDYERNTQLEDDESEPTAPKQ